MEKHYNKNWLSPLYRGLLLTLTLFFASSMAMAQMSGTYTMDDAGGGDFVSFTAFKDSMAARGGVKGPVVVNVKSGSGPYLENVSFGAVSGTSATNTITINGNGTTIKNTSTSVGYVIQMNSADYFTFNGLKIEAANNIAGTRCMQFYNGSDYNTVKGCELIVSACTQTGSSTAYVAFTSSTTGNSAAAHGSNNTFDGNKMWSNDNSGKGPYYGIVDYRSSGQSSVVGNNVYKNNDIMDVYYYGAYFYYNNGIQFTSNKIHDVRSNTSSFYGIYVNYCYATSVANVIEKNDLYDLKPSSTLYGYYFNNADGTSSLTTKINNNTFKNSTGSTIYGTQVLNTDYVEVKNNTTSGNQSRGYLYYAGMYGSYNNYCDVSGNKVTGNTAGSYMYYTFYANYCNNMKVNSNEMASNYSSTYIYYSFFSNRSDNIELIGNKFTGNSAGSYIYYAFRTYYGTGIIVKDNQLLNNTATYFYYPFYIYYGTNVDVIGNEVGKNSATYMYGYYTYRNDNFKLHENSFHDNKADYFYYGFMFYYASNATMLNNVYYNNDCAQYNYYTMYNGYGDNNVIAHNTFVLDDNLSYNYYTWYIYYYNTPANIKIHNNIMYMKGSLSGAYPIYCYYNADKISWEKNVIYDVSSGNKNWYANASAYATFAQWQSVAGDKTSVSVDPGFVNAAGGDLTPTNPVIANIGIPDHADLDYIKKTRTECGPDPGAYEFFVDHSASNFTFAGVKECGGYREAVQFDFTSGVNIAMKDVSVYYTINGGTPVIEKIPTVASKSKVTYTFKEIAEFHEPGDNVIEVGLLCDDDASNNTLKKTINITPAPHSFDMTEGATFPGYFRAGGSGGTMTNPDITAKDLEINYDVANPAKYSNSTYGATGWTLTPMVYTSGGMVVASTNYTPTYPSGSNGAELAFKPGAGLVDSTVFVGYKVKDENTKCDSIFGRWVYIPPTPSVAFDKPTGCDGDVISFVNKTTQAKGLVEYAWDFGDPGSGKEDNKSTISDPVHKFSTYGSFDVTMSAWNFAYPKFVYTLTQTVSISPVPAVCFKVTNACEGDFIKFTNCTTSPVSGTIQYSWSFGDNTAKSTAKDPTHKYLKAGGYAVTLNASLQGCNSSLTKNANQFARPVADFSQNGKCNLEEITFTNGTTIALGNTGYKWDFGDGVISNLPTPTHAFEAKGSHTVKLRAISEFGCAHEVSKTFTLAESPKSDFTFTDACNLKAVDFKRGGTLPAGSSSIYKWDFDGETVSTKENPSHLFSTVGVKKVSLQIVSNNGCSDVITKEFVVKLQAKADFTATNVCEGDEVVFTNKSTVASGNLNYTWRLGDGENSNLTSPRHAYELQKVGETESFNVTLVAIVPGGCSDSIARSVTVNAKSNAMFDAKANWRKLVISNQATTDPTNTYNWRFGDGGRSSKVTPTYEYLNIDKGMFEVCLNIINNAGCASEHCEMVEVNLATSGINDVSNNIFSVYPNPNRGMFNVKINNAQAGVQIVIMDAMGKTVRTINTQDATGIYGVDLSDVASGVYLVQVTNGSTSAIERVTISK